MKKHLSDEEVEQFVYNVADTLKSKNDPTGAYTGVGHNKHEKPQQDVDDL